MLHKCAVACVAVLAIAGAYAAEDDKVMGNYHGGFVDDAWRDNTLRAQVVGMSDNRWRAVIFVGADGIDEVRTEIKGRAAEGENPEFEGDIDLGDALGGKYTVSGTIADETFTGTFAGDGGEGAFELARVFLEPPTRGAEPPAGAVVLMGGDNLDGWTRSPEKWCIQPDGSAQVCSSNFKTLEEFGDAEYHIEFRTPYMPDERYQGRGNSGVYIQGRYEVQVLDSFGTPPAWDLCGGIYKVAVPEAEAALPPLQWQTYDITFTAPKFDGDGKKTSNARITVVHNGITVHDDLELPDVTPGGLSGTEAAMGPLMLQDHSDPVRYRNIWVKPLD
jgi:hypothetical protein